MARPPSYFAKRASLPNNASCGISAKDQKQIFIVVIQLISNDSEYIFEQASARQDPEGNGNDVDPRTTFHLPLSENTKDMLECTSVDKINCIGSFVFI